MADVFLSYARADRARAEPILARLQQFGLTVFFDIEDGVRAGDAFPQVIANEVIAAKCVVACWSQEALGRPWCRRECFLALERGTLVPVTIGPVTATDLREFVDISYEDLTDFSGQEKHFGLSQTLRAVAQSFERWAEKNASHPECEAALVSASQLRLTSLKVRPDGSDLNAQKAASARSELWEKLKTTDDVGRLIRFAESFPNSVESFHARDLAAAWEAFRKGYQRYDPDLHRKLAEYAVRIPDLSAMVDEALQRDDQSILSSMTCKKALELRDDYLGEVWSSVSFSVGGGHPHPPDWLAFADKWPNHPYVAGMFKYIAEYKEVMSLAQPMQDRLRERNGAIGELLHLHREAVEEDLDRKLEEEQDTGTEEAESDPWYDRGRRTDPEDEVELLDCLPEIEGASKLEHLQVAERALLEFREQKQRREEAAKQAARDVSQPQDTRPQVAIGEASITAPPIQQKGPRNLGAKLLIAALGLGSAAAYFLYTPNESGSVTGHLFRSLSYGFAAFVATYLVSWLVMSARGKPIDGFFQKHPGLFVSIMALVALSSGLQLMSAMQTDGLPGARFPVDDRAEQLQREVETLRAKLPTQLGDGIAMTSIINAGDMITFGFSLDDDKFEPRDFGPRVEDDFKKYACSDPGMTQFLTHFEIPIVLSFKIGSNDPIYVRVAPSDCR